MPVSRLVDAKPLIAGVPIMIIIFDSSIILLLLKTSNEISRLFDKEG